LRRTFDQVASFPFRGGEMGELIRAFDWSKTSLGAISEWPAPSFRDRAIGIIIEGPQNSTISARQYEARPWPLSEGRRRDKPV
jgi:hypothetical protein